MFLRLLVIVSGSLFIACSSSKKIKSNAVVNYSEFETLAGLEIIKKHDCLTCHSFKEKLIGPSFLDISNKYEFNLSNIDKLSNKIIKGGNGAWGKVPMTPHTSMSKEDAEAMIKYILLLNK